MLKKFLSAFAAIAILLHSFLPAIVFAVTTDEKSSPWTLQKAEHLARKVYFAATDEKIRALYDAGSAAAAVNIVFPDQTGPNRAQFNDEITTLTASGFNWGDGGHMSRLYHFRYARDPYESKAKLRSLYEDIFSVNQSDQISYKDIIDQHDLLDTYTLGNYKSLVKKILFNNGSPGDYPTGKFLDLLDQSNKNYPNENYSRELLQLFLMGEYYPTESKEAGDTRNYEETDVQALAKILTGFVSNTTTHVVSYDSTKHNTSTGVLFLNGPLKAGSNFLFMDGSGALDLSSMALPSSGNNGLADNSIDYIFAARERAIAGFLADRLFRFYVHNSPTRAQIDAIVATIIAENFEMLPVVRSILTSDAMYSDASMNAVTYKNPLELAIGTTKLLHAKSPELIDPMLRDTQLLSRLNWTPFFPGSIFGRDGFDDNAKFYSTYIQNQWITYTNRIAYDTASGAYRLSDFLPYTHTGITQDVSFSRFTQLLSGSLQIQSGVLEYTPLTTSGSSLSGSSLSGSVSLLSLSAASDSEFASTGSVSDTVISETNSGTANIVDAVSSGTLTSTGIDNLPLASSGSVAQTGGIVDTLSNTGVTSSSTGTTNSGTVVNENSSTGAQLLNATGSLSGSTSLQSSILSNLTLTGGMFTLSNMSVMTASGLFQLDVGTYNPNTNIFLVQSGSLGSGTGKVFVSSGTIQFTPTSVITRDISPVELITALEKTLLVTRSLPNSVKTGLINYLTTDSNGNPSVFLPSNTTFQNTRIKGVIAIILMQPEFVMQTGFDLPVTPINTENSVLAATQSKLLFVELGGGYDWLHGVIPKSEYSDYVAKRTNSSGGTIVIDSAHVVDIDNFYLNSALAYGSGSTPSLKSLYDSGNLRIFNRVGAPKHSRDHDQAQKQIASYLAITNDDADGVFGQLIKYEPSSESTISLSGKKPNVFRNGRFINIGPSGAIFQNGYLSQTERNKQLGAARTILQGREYPANTAGLFTSAVRIDEIAQISKNAGGPDGAGYGNVNNLNFLRTLLSNNVGKTFFMQGDGGYDTHSNQLAPQSNFDPMNIPKDLNYNIGRVVSNLTTFFNDVKSTQDITIVVFSEFGRTTEVNGDLGTDHGQGGGMFVISNNAKLLQNLGQKTYGNMSIKNAEENWLGVGVDYRAVYGKIYNALYGVSDTTHFGVVKDLAKEVSQVPANFTLLRGEYKALNDGSATVRVKFTMEGDNFDSTQASYIKANWQKDPNSNNPEMQQINTWVMNNYYKKPNNEYFIARDWINMGRSLSLDMTAYTNQYAESMKLFSATVPKIVRSSAPAVVTGTGNTLFRKFESTIATDSGTQLSGTGVILADLPLPYIISGTGSTGSGTTSTGSTSSGTTSTGSVASGSVTESLVMPSLMLESTDGIRLTMTGGLTAVQKVTASSGTGTWNGGFILGENVPVSDFIGSKALIRGTTQKLQEQGVEKLVRIGSDTLGIGMELNQPVRVSIPVSTNKPYKLYSSEDGMLWTLENAGQSFTATGGRVDFMTTHFTYFALADATAIPPPACNIVASQTQVTNGTSVTLTWGTSNSIGATLAPGFGNVALSGSLVVVPPSNTGTPYVLTARNLSNLTTSCQVIVTAVGTTNPPGSGSGSGTGVVLPPIYGSGGTGVVVPPPAPNPNSNAGAPVPGGGSGLPILSVFSQDICPNGDTSGSKFDGKCSSQSKMSTDSEETGTGTNDGMVTSPIESKVTAKGLRVPNKKSVKKAKLTPVDSKNSEVQSVEEKTTETKKTLETIQDARGTEIAPAQPKESEKKKTTSSTVDEALLLGMQQLLFTSDATLSSYNWDDGRRLPYSVYSILDTRMSTIVATISEQDASTAYVSRLEGQLRRTLQTSTNFQQKKMAEYYLTELYIASKRVTTRR